METCKSINILNGLKLILAFCLLTVSACATAQKQSKKNTSKAASMERFNIHSFEEHQRNNEYIFESDGKKVTQRLFPERREYVEETEEALTAISTVKVFYMDSGRLKLEGQRLHRMPIRTWNYYTPEGTLSRKKDWEAGYRFTLEEMIRKVKEVYKVDLMQKNPQVDVEREDDEDERKAYTIVYPVGAEQPGNVYIISLDGLTGQEIEKKINTVKH